MNYLLKSVVYTVLALLKSFWNCLVVWKVFLLTSGQNLTLGTCIWFMITSCSLLFLNNSLTVLNRQFKKIRHLAVTMALSIFWNWTKNMWSCLGLYLFYHSLQHFGNDIWCEFSVHIIFIFCWEKLFFNTYFMRFIFKVSFII